MLNLRRRGEFGGRPAPHHPASLDQEVSVGDARQRAGHSCRSPEIRRGRTPSIARGSARFRRGFSAPGLRSPRRESRAWGWSLARDRSPASAARRRTIDCPCWRRVQRGVETGRGHDRASSRRLHAPPPSPADFRARSGLEKSGVLPAPDQYRVARFCRTAGRGFRCRENGCCRRAPASAPSPNARSWSCPCRCGRAASPSRRAQW